MNLNYQHLYYFWIVARAPSLTAAAHRLDLSPSTVSTQIKVLEEKIGQPLFERRGRGLVLTARGRVALAYADDIFSLGDELIETLRSSIGSPSHAYRLRVGFNNNFPKLLAYHLLSPSIHCDGFPVHLVCVQGDPSSLAADLAVHHFDLVITDQPVSLASELPIESQLLCKTSVSLMGTPDLVSRYRDQFPHSLQNAPLLLPTPDAQMRQILELYFHRQHIQPHVVAEFGDSALLKSFGQEGVGLFPIPSLVVDAVSSQYHVEELGVLEGIEEEIFVVFSSDSAQNVAIKSILDHAQNSLRYEGNEVSS